MFEKNQSPEQPKQHLERFLESIISAIGNYFKDLSFESPQKPLTGIQILKALGEYPFQYIVENSKYSDYLNLGSIPYEVHTELDGSLSQQSNRLDRHSGYSLADKVTATIKYKPEGQDAGLKVEVVLNQGKLESVTISNNNLDEGVNLEPIKNNLVESIKPMVVFGERGRVQSVVEAAFGR